MTDKKDLITLRLDEVRGPHSTYRQEGKHPAFPVWIFDMPPNEKSETLREGDEIIYNNDLFKVHRREEVGPPQASERYIKFWLVPPGFSLPESD